jgi:DNA-binding transcriptional LysR family regulator
MGAMQVGDRIGRRMKLQDLHVLMTVAQAGSMGKAARQLNTTQPAISRSIAELERALGVRLLDRSRQGIEPTAYGRALLGCSMAVFDELRQGVRTIEFLTDPSIGEIRIGGNEAIIAGLLPAVFGRLHGQYPGIAVHVTPVVTVSQQYHELRERKLDLILGRVAESNEEDVDVEVLFYERAVVVAGLQSKWVRRRKIELAELADEPWSLPPPGSLVGSLVAEAFRASGIECPRRGVATGSIHLHSALLARGPFLGIFPVSMLRFAANLPPLKVLPVELPVRPGPVGIMTLKNRTLSPATRLFIEYARETVKPLAKGK